MVTRALVGLAGARHQFQKRRFAGAVDAHHAPALLAPDREIEPLVDRLAAIVLVNVFERHDIVAGARRRLEIECHGLAAPGRLDAVDLIELLDPALHLGGMRGARLEPLDELDLLGQHRLLAFELRLLLLLVQLALLGVELVIAGIGVERAAVDLDDLVDDAVHELAVVAGHQQRAIVALEKLFEPDQAFEIEMVAWLVEQHRIGPHQQNSRQRDTHLPAARKLANIAVHHLLAEAQAAQHLARAAFERVAVKLLEAGLHLAVTLDDGLHLVQALRVRHGGLKLLQLGPNGAHRPGAVHDLGHGAMPRHFANVLVEIADGDAAIRRHLALVGRILAGDHTEQRRLAGSIRSDKANPLAFQETGRSLDEQEMIAVLLADVFETNHDHRSFAGIPWQRYRASRSMSASRHP